jgi:hypothetical protein
MFERLRILAEILAFLGQREPKLNLSAPVRASCQQRLEARDVVARRRLHPQLRTVEIGLEIPRPLRNDPIVIRFCSFEITHEATHRSTVVDELRIVRRQSDGPS